MAKKPNLGDPKGDLLKQENLDLLWFEIKALEIQVEKKKKALLELSIIYKKKGIVSRQFNVVDSMKVDSKLATEMLLGKGYERADFTISYTRFNGKKALKLIGEECPMKVSQYLQKKKQLEDF